MNARNISIRVLQEADIPGAMRLKNAENWNQTEEDWRTLISLDPDLCLVACCGDKVVGTVTATNYHGEIAWIGMMLVDKGFRGLGLGKRLLTACIEKLGECKSIKLDATAAGLPMYKKLGFVEEWKVDRMVVSNLNCDLPGERDRTVKPLTTIKLDEAIRLDREAFGADRSRLFAEFLVKNANKARCLEKAGRLSGYVLGRTGSNYPQVGPLSAESDEEAGVLLKAVLKNYLGRPVLVDVLQDKKYLKELLSSLGFVTQRSFIRMYLKSNPSPASLQKYFLIAGPELG